MISLPRTLAASVRVLGLVLLFALLAEQGLRVQKFGLAGFSPSEMESVKRLLMSEFGMEPSERILQLVGTHGLMPNTTGISMGEAFEVNNFGLRGEDVTREKPEGVFRVAAVGGSLTMGPSIPLAKTWTEVFEKKLNETRGDEPVWEVLNFGIPYTQRSLSRHFQRALYFQPDIIVWQIPSSSDAKEMRDNLALAAKFAKRHSIQVFAFALDKQTHTAASNQYFELLPPLGVEYGPEHYIYPSDSHPDSFIHKRYGMRLFRRIDSRREKVLEIRAASEIDFTSSYEPVKDPVPWKNPHQGFWHSYLAKRFTQSFAVTRTNFTTLPERLPWSDKAK